MKVVQRDEEIRDCQKYLELTEHVYNDIGNNFNLQFKMTGFKKSELY